MTGGAPGGPTSSDKPCTAKYPGAEGRKQSRGWGIVLPHGEGPFPAAQPEPRGGCHLRSHRTCREEMGKLARKLAFSSILSALFPESPKRLHGRPGRAASDPITSTQEQATDSQQPQPESCSDGSKALQNRAGAQTSPLPLPITSPIHISAPCPKPQVSNTAEKPRLHFAGSQRSSREVPRAAPPVPRQSHAGKGTRAEDTATSCQLPDGWDQGFVHIRLLEPARHSSCQQTRSRFIPFNKAA